MTEQQLDLTGKPARFDGALRGKAISWQAFASLTDRPIPPSAVLRRKQPRPCPEPRPEPQYWLDRLCRFARRYTDPTRHWRGWKPKPPEQATVPFLVLLAPLSATALARHHIASLAAPAAAVQAHVARRRPLAEEHVAGRVSARCVNAADWFQRDIEASAGALVDGVRMRTSTGEMVPSGSRDPESLWPVEAAADRAIRLRSRFRTLGPLARLVWQALNGAEMADLAPAWPLPQRHRAEAGRIRLRAGLELCARMAERMVDHLPQWEILEVVQAACDQCTKLEATRRIRVLNPANDNIPQRIAA